MLRFREPPVKAARKLPGRSSASGILLLLGLLFLPAAAWSASVVRINVPDLTLTDQHGRSGRFLTDVIGNRIGAVTFTYTTCTTICPVLDGIFKSLQGRMADSLGRDIVLITISIDPVTDIPVRLKAHADKLGAKPGWIFLTGEKTTMDRVLKGLEVYSTDILNHPPTVFIVDGRRKVWSRLYGFPSPKLIEQELKSSLARR